MSDRLSITELTQQPAYLALTAQQRVLVEKFLETADKVQAVQAAYNCKSKESARVMSYSVFSNLRVVAALAAANGGCDLESFKQEVMCAARNKKLSIAQLGALKLYAQLSGFVAGSSLSAEIDSGEIAEQPAPSESPVAEHCFKVGDICLQDGKQFRVTAIDANGRPTDGEPI